MANYAQINDQGRVVGTSQLSGRVDRPNLIEVADTTGLMGKVWNGETFEDGPAPEPEPPSPELTRLAFLDRFTTPELVEIYTAAKQSVELEVWLDKVRAAQEINLTDQRTKDGVAMLETSGLIAEGRADDILTP